MNIIKINQNKTTIVEKGNHDVIKKLENLLYHAKNGTLVGFACITLANDDSMDSTYAGEVHENYLSFQGMIHDLSLELKTWYEEDDNA